MKVLHFYKRSLPQSFGGVESFIDTLCSTISKYDVINNVLSISIKPPKKVIKYNNYKVYYAKENLYIASTSLSFNAIFLFKKLISEVDIIHFHYPYPYADFINLLNFSKKPYLITYHSDIIRQKRIEFFYRPLRDVFLNGASRIIATSPNYFATSRCLQTHSNKVDIIPIGIDKKSYKVDKKFSATYKKKFNNPFFLFLGEFRYYKGLKILIDAVKDTHINLVLAGAIGTEKELMEYINSNNIKNIKLLGRVSKKAKLALLDSCYSFVFPSNLRAEAFGIALLEAGLFKKPLISCEIGTGTSFVNIHKKTGLVIIPGNAKELYNAMDYLLKNPIIAEEMGENSYKRVLSLFNAELQAKAYLKVYKEILNQR